MGRMSEFRNKLRYLSRRERFDAEMEEEMHLHMEERAEELMVEGVDRKEAVMRARREFGSTARIQEDARVMWHFRWQEDLLSDLRYAARAMGKSPGFALAGILSLALGTGANTTAFSLMMEFLFSEPSVERPGSLVTMRVGGASHALMEDYRLIRDSNPFDGVAGMREEGEANWRWGDESKRLHVMRVTDNFFEVTGTPLMLGRGMAAGERNTVVVNHAFWKTQLGGNPDIVGRTLVLDGQPYIVAGVLPEHHRTIFGFGFAPELYMPVVSESERVKLVVRLPEGMTKGMALAAIKAAAASLDEIHPPKDGNLRTRDVEVSSVTGVDRVKGKSPIIAFFGMLMIVVGLVLLVACMNVASLHLARAASRRHELAVRRALGAGRWRVARQLLTESLLLAALGTLCGLALNVALTGIINRVPLPLPVPIRLAIAPDWRLVTYAALVALGCAAIAGVMPALAASRAGVQAGMKSEERSVGGSRWSLRSFVVAGQLAVTVLLLTTGLLFLRNLSRATNMHPGFDAETTTWATLRLVPERYSRDEQIQTALDQALDRLRSVPGVESAAVARVVPLNDSIVRSTTMKPDTGGEVGRVRAQLNWTGPDYFRTMDIALVARRDFTPADRTGAEDSVIINETLARLLFGAISPVGHTFSWGTERNEQTFRVVGVAKDSKYFTLGEENAAAVYHPFAQQGSPGTTLHLLVRSSRDPVQLGRELRSALAGVDSSAAIEVRPMKSALGLAFLPSRVGAALLGSMGALGLLLAAVGLHGVLSYAVSRRMREIGLRMALGASPEAVLRMVLRQSLALVVSGIAVGLLIAVFATQPLAMFLVPDVRPSDPITYLAVCGLLLFVAIAATAGPATRALRVDPTVALRYE